MNRGGDELVRLPPGFRFHPTNEEIITHYLIKKVIDGSFTATAIGEVDLNKCEPWDLPKKAKMGEKEWYFFCQKDRKYPTGTRTNRATVSGYWKATGKDKEIRRGKNCLVGMKKTLVFYLGRAPKGEKTTWVMHEYRLEGNVPFYGVFNHNVAKDEWTVCRVFNKSTDIKNPNPIISGMPRMNSTKEEFSIGSLTPLVDPSYSGGAGSSFTDGESEHKATQGNSSAVNPNNIADNINNYMNPASSYQMNPSPNQPVFHPSVQTNANHVFRALGPTKPMSYYFQQLGNMNIAQCKLEPYQSRSMISGPEYTELDTGLNPEISSGNMKQEPLSGIVPQFEDVLDPFIGPPGSDNLLGFSWDY